MLEHRGTRHVRVEAILNDSPVELSDDSSPSQYHKRFPSENLPAESS